MPGTWSWVGSLCFPLQRAGVVLEEGLRKRPALKEMGSVRGAVEMVAQPQSLGCSVRNGGDPASAPLLCLIPEGN